MERIEHFDPFNISTRNTGVLEEGSIGFIDRNSESMNNSPRTEYYKDVTTLMETRYLFRRAITEAKGTSASKKDLEIITSQRKGVLKNGNYFKRTSKIGDPVTRIEIDGVSRNVKLIFLNNEDAAAILSCPPREEY